MKYLFVMVSVLVSSIVSAQTTIYSFKLDSIAGGATIDLSTCQGKKILLVNGASGDSSGSQYAELKQLSNAYKSTLIIIVVPSNSFNTENATDLAMREFYSQESTNRFPVTSKLSVKGADICPLYQWLTQKARNGVMDSEVRRPFQKYLIDESGKIIGVFSGRIRPLDQPVIQAIARNRN